MMLQLDPTIPMMTPRGSGYALFVVDYSQEHHLMWVVALDDGGEIWMFENPDVRVQSNFTLGRRPDRAFGMRMGAARSRPGVSADSGAPMSATGMTPMPPVSVPPIPATQSGQTPESQTPLLAAVPNGIAAHPPAS